MTNTTSAEQAAAILAANGHQDPPPAERGMTQPAGPAELAAPERDRPWPHQDVYQGLLGQAAQDLCQTSEADPVAVLATAIAGFGAMAGPNAHVRIGHDAHPALVWPLILGHTGIGRKGTSWGVAKSLLRPSDPVFAREGFTAGLSSGEGLIAAVADGQDDTDPGGKARLVVETEYSVTMRRSAREGNSLGGVLRQAWDGDDLAVMTKSTVHATAPHIAILAHITPAEFRSCVRGSEMAGGTYNRFLPIYSERFRVIPDGEGAEEELLTKLADAMATALMTARTAGKVGLTPAARELWTEVVYPALSEAPGADGPVAQFTARATAYARRIAMIYALADGKAIVDHPHLMAAYHLVNYSRATAAFVLGGDNSTGDPHLDKALFALVEAGPSGLTRSEISGVFSRKLSAVSLDDLLAKLEALPEVTRTERTGAGRTATVWALSAAKEAKEAKDAR